MFRLLITHAQIKLLYPPNLLASSFTLHDCSKKAIFAIGFNHRVRPGVCYAVLTAFQSRQTSVVSVNILCMHMVLMHRLH